jgi:hypothetical protein
MAEALALGSSIIGVIQIADRVISLCKWYIETAREAPSDLRTILVETSTTKTILETLQFLVDCSHGPLTTLNSLTGDEGPIEGCRRTVAELEELFPTDSAPKNRRGKSKKGKMDNALKALAWPFKEKRAKKVLKELSRYKMIINLALSTDSA